jgi:nitrogen regulatory protein PII
MFPAETQRDASGGDGRIFVVNVERAVDLAAEASVEGKQPVLA